MVVSVTGVLLELCCERRKKALSSLLYARYEEMAREITSDALVQSSSRHF